MFCLHICITNIKGIKLVKYEQFPEVALPGDNLPNRWSTKKAGQLS